MSNSFDENYEPIAESIYMDLMVFLGAVAVVFTMVDIMLLMLL